MAVHSWWRVPKSPWVSGPGISPVSAASGRHPGPPLNITHRGCSCSPTSGGSFPSQVPSGPLASILQFADSLTRLLSPSTSLLSGLLGVLLSYNTLGGGWDRGVFARVVCLLAGTERPLLGVPPEESGLLWPHPWRLQTPAEPPLRIMPVPVFSSVMRCHVGPPAPWAQTPGSGCLLLILPIL